MPLFVSVERSRCTYITAQHLLHSGEANYALNGPIIGRQAGDKSSVGSFLLLLQVLLDYYCGGSSVVGTSASSTSVIGTSATATSMAATSANQSPGSMVGVRTLAFVPSSFTVLPSLCP